MALSFNLNRSSTGDNLVLVTSQLLSLLKTNVSFTTLKETLLSYPKNEELIEEIPDWQVQIILTASGNKEERSTAPAAYMLAIAAQQDESMIRKALDEWYNAIEKKL